MTEWVRNYSKKYQEVGLVYDYDLLDKQRLIRIRITNEDPPLPVTPTYQARFKTDIPVRAIPKRHPEHEPRKIELCYVNPNNKTGETIRTVYNPYKPNTHEHKQMVQELLQGQFGFEALNYKGEVFNSNFEILLNQEGK